MRIHREYGAASRGFHRIWRLALPGGPRYAACLRLTRRVAREGGNKTLKIGSATADREGFKKDAESIGANSETGRGELELGVSVEVLPFVGFGAVRLGMQEGPFREQLGVPDEITREYEGDVTLSYAQQGFQVTFYASDDSRLGSITFESERFVVQGNRVVGVSVERLVELGAQGVLPGIYLEQDWPELAFSNYDCDHLGLSFWVQNDVVESMTLYPRYDESGEHPIFPES